ncbi:MAG: thioredoxin family protein [Bacteroidota bacterium]
MSEQVIENTITSAHLESAMNYQTYKSLIDGLLKENKTTGYNHSEAMIEYTKLNASRMNKWDKIAKISESLASKIASISTKQYWVVLTEGWCGDAGQNVPVMNKLSELNPNIEIKFLLRDENLDVMDNYLTNGGRSIPKLVILDHELNELGTWGPRPAPAQQMVKDFKENPTTTYQEFSKDLHTWYAKDKTLTLQKELENILDGIA